MIISGFIWSVANYRSGPARTLDGKIVGAQSDSASGTDIDVPDAGGAIGPW